MAESWGASRPYWLEMKLAVIGPVAGVFEIAVVLRKSELLRSKRADAVHTTSADESN